MLKKMSDFFCVSIEYLVGATNYRNNNASNSSSENLSSDEKEIIKAYRNLSFDQQKVIKVQLKVLSEEFV